MFCTDMDLCCANWAPFLATSAAAIVIGCGESIVCTLNYIHDDDGVFLEEKYCALLVRAISMFRYSATERGPPPTNAHAIDAVPSRTAILFTGVGALCVAHLARAVPSSVHPPKHDLDNIMRGQHAD